MTSVGLALLTVALLALPDPRTRIRRADPTACTTRPPSTTDPLAVAGTLDLLAACLRAGLPTATAARAVAEAAPTPLATELRHAADRLALGAEPDTAWDLPSLPDLARIARRSAQSGTALAASVAELARDHRDAMAATASATAERAGVLIAGPLGLCFLPAFICLGLAPTVIGLIQRLVAGGAL